MFVFNSHLQYLRNHKKRYNFQNKIQVEGKYEITANSFSSKLDFSTPYENLSNGRAEVRAAFNYPFSYEFKAAAKTDDVIFDVDVALSLESTDHKFFRFGAVVPALGLDENDLKVALGYRMVSPNDFELESEATIAGTPRKAVLKFRFLNLHCH